MESAIGSVVQYLANVILTTFLKLFVLMGPGLILAFLMHLVAGGLDRLATQAIGWKLYYALFSFLGTMVHELGHAFFNLIFGHKILNIKLTNRDPNLGETAHVAYAYNPRNIYQRIGVFFSAIGPILFGTTVIYLMAILLLGPNEFEPLRNMRTTADMFTSVKGIGLLLTGILGGGLDSLANIFTLENLGDWKLWVFLYLAFSIGSNISLSPADLKGATIGFVTLFTVVLLLNLVTLWMGDFITRGVHIISQFNGVFYAVMLIALMLSLLGAFFMFIILIFRRLVLR
jgi:hypothetical protein